MRNSGDSGRRAVLPYGRSYVLAAACGGTTPSDPPYACGKVLCQTGELCVHPCCGGAPPACLAKPDGGACPAGFTEDATCLGNQGGCRAAPCTPPEPFCSANPNCVPTTTGRDAYCVCA